VSKLYPLTLQNGNPDGIVSVHHPVFPAEIRDGDPISASIRLTEHTSASKVKLPVYRLTPLGADLDITELASHSIKVGSEIDLSLEIAKQKCDFFGIAVAEVHSENGRTIAGIRWCQDAGTRTESDERRGASRWLCGEQFLPNGTAPNPARFNDFIYFTVIDISKNGMQLSTSLRNKFLVKGMILEANISFPMIGQLTVHLKITNARIRSNGGKEFLALGTSILDMDPETLQTIGQYLIQFGPKVSLSELRDAGFIPTSTESAVEFSFAKTAQEYREVLNLRKLAYADAGKISSEANSDEMADIFDSKSRILMARHMGEVVGSLRITFHSPDEDNEYDQFVTFPENFPRRDELVVLSRICTHSKYRGSDLFYGLMRHCVLAVLQSKRRYILGGCTDSLLPLYQRVGFKSKGLRYEHATLNGVQEQIIMADVLGILSGRDTSVTIWNEIFSDLTNYITKLYDVPFDPAMNARLAMYRAASPFTRLFTAGVRKPRKS
jgi:predicted GNAT family N-acyltransferase